MKTFPLVVAAGVLSGAAIFANAFAADDEKTAPMPATTQIAVTRSWGDLLAQKPASVRSAGCKLGISAATGAVNGAVVLYCFTEKDPGEVPDGEDTLGPLTVDVEGPGDAIAQVKEKRSALAYARREAAGYLYMKIVPLRIEGKYRVKLSEETKEGDKLVTRVVAEAAVEVAGKPAAQAWSPWCDPDKEQPADALAEGDDEYASMDVANPPGGVALPDWPGYERVAIEKLPKAAQPLPPVFPAETDPSVKLEIKDGDLAVKLDEEISIYFPDEKFLTRWWVNGKPFVPDPAKLPQQKPRALAAPEILVKEARFHMEFHPERLGVKKGDTVAVQLLFCRRGWTALGEAQMARQKEAQLRDGEPVNLLFISRLSNKVEFVYSGDPTKPVQK
ncbi:MAG TPA: hypothetical protein VG733_01320 [Chthoniobacteraceae bacterium]|nr:hypothetical protein [Chthoniobacteraceae bacterium]